MGINAIKSDVFSFGILLITLLTEKPVLIDEEFDNNKNN